MKLGPSGSRFETNEKLSAASFEISQMIAISKKSHNIAETLIKPCILKAAEEVLGKEAANKLSAIPLSNNTVKARIQNMADDIEVQLVEKVKKSPYFGIQCDESTDVGNCAQLLAFVRYLDQDNAITEEVFLCEALETTARGMANIFCWVGIPHVGRCEAQTSGPVAFKTPDGFNITF